MNLLLAHLLGLPVAVHALVLLDGFCSLVFVSHAPIYTPLVYAHGLLGVDITVCGTYSEGVTDVLVR